MTLNVNIVFIPGIICDLHRLLVLLMIRSANIDKHKELIKPKGQIKVRERTHKQRQCEKG